MRTVFPVVATEPGRTTELTRADFFGTAFAVADGLFFTAAHVVNAAAAHGALSLGGPTDTPMMGGAPVTRWEIWPDRDIALLFCNTGPVTHLNIWLTSRVQVLTDLSSFGYPHAVTRANDQEHFEVVFRAYKGHVVTTRGFDRLQDKPAIYEVSCPFPEGLSGGPLLLNHEGQLAVVGIVLGSETVTYAGVDHTVGVAMIADEILELSSTILGGSLRTALPLNLAELRPRN